MLRLGALTVLFSFISQLSLADGGLLDPQTAITGFDFPTLRAIAENRVPSDYPPEATYRSLHELIQDIEDKDGDALEARVTEILTLFKIGRQRGIDELERGDHAQLRHEARSERHVLRTPYGRVQINLVDDNFVIELHPKNSNKVWFFSEVSTDSDSVKTLIANHHLRAGTSREDGKSGRDVIYIRLRKSQGLDAAQLEPASFMYFPRARPVLLASSTVTFLISGANALTGNFAPLVNPVIPLPKHLFGIETPLLLTEQGRRDAKYAIFKDGTPTAKQVILNGAACSAVSGCVMFLTLVGTEGIQEAVTTFKGAGALSFAVGLLTGSFTTILARYKNYGSVRERIQKNTWIPTFFANIFIYSAIHWNDPSHPLFSNFAPLVLGRLYISAFLGATTKTHVYEIVDMLKEVDVKRNGVNANGDVPLIKNLTGIGFKRDDMNRFLASVGLDFLKFFDLVEGITVGGFSFGKLIAWSAAPLAIFAKVKLAEHLEYEHAPKMRKEWEAHKAAWGKYTGYHFVKSLPKGLAKASSDLWFLTFASLGVGLDKMEQSYQSNARSSGVVTSCLHEVKKLSIRLAFFGRPSLAQAQ